MSSFYFLLRLLFLSLLTTFSMAEEGQEEKPFVWEQTKMKTFSDRERRDECNKYEGGLLGYYGKIFLVENCKRREIVGKELIRKLFKESATKVISVDGDTLIKLESGEPYTTLPKQKREIRRCKDLEGSYVIHGGSDIYFIEGCTLRLLPDYETYQSHIKKKNLSRVLIEISKREFLSFAKGKEIESIMPSVHSKLMERWQEVDVIPVDEACLGINNQFVTYYSKVYRIDSCYKREVVDVSSFLKKYQDSSSGYKELSSEQWLSLPEGKAWK